MSIHLALLASSSGSIYPFLPVLLLLFGIVLFILGFRIYRQYRIMADTPLIAVQIVPMGLVHVSGSWGSGSWDRTTRKICLGGWGRTTRNRCSI
jgi:uncharacterized protein YqgC (DUF456 family)